MKKTENRQVDEGFFADFVIVYIKMIIDFNSFLFTFSLKTHSPGHKHIIKYGIIITVLVVSDVQIETLKIKRCQKLVLLVS